MGKLIDLTGSKFGRLTVICRDGSTIQGKPLWRCRCICGKETHVSTMDLKTGNTRSCGCYKIDRLTKHRDCRKKLYVMWQHMKRRCFDTNDSSYQWYGGRGIIVCDAWINSYSAFKDFALTHGYKEGLSIERIDVNGNYEPCNVRFISIHEQGKNKTNSVLYLGINQADWARRLGIPQATICCHRLKHSCTLEEAVKFYIAKRHIEIDTPDNI
jgi:hypothetical protein